MGTRFEFVLIAEDSVRTRAIGEEALDEVRRLEAELSRFRRDSWTALIERNARTGPLVVPADLFEFFVLCDRVFGESGGGFDCAFRPGRESLADSAEGAVTGDGSWADVELDATHRTVQLRRDLCLDFGAIGKGWALDRAGEVLREAGIESAFLHGGTSSVLAIGRTPSQGAWEVGIPVPGLEGRLARASLRDCGFSVSAVDGKMRGENSGAHAGHIVDPNTGQPSRGARMVAVTASTAAEADAWSTALVVRPDLRVHWPRLVVRQEGQSELMGERVEQIFSFAAKTPESSKESS